MAWVCAALSTLAQMGPTFQYTHFEKFKSPPQKYEHCTCMLRLSTGTLLSSYGAMRERTQGVSGILMRLPFAEVKVE